MEGEGASQDWGYLFLPRAGRGEQRHLLWRNWTEPGPRSEVLFASIRVRVTFHTHIPFLGFEKLQIEQGPSST